MFHSPYIRVVHGRGFISALSSLTIVKVPLGAPTTLRFWFDPRTERFFGPKGTKRWYYLWPDWFTGDSTSTSRQIYYPRTSVETRTQPWQYRNGTNRRRRSYLRMSDYRVIFCRSLPTTCTFSSPRPFVVRFRLLIGGVCFSVTDACVSRYEDLNDVYITVHSHFYSWRFQGGGRGTGEAFGLISLFLAPLPTSAVCTNVYQYLTGC